MDLPMPAREYLLVSLDHTPATLSALLSGLPPGDPAWDVRPYPDRFTLREIVAHLADWETVWEERFARTLAEATPTLRRPDITARAGEKGYATADPSASLAQFTERRAANTASLRALPGGDSDWTRAAHLDRIGDMPLEGIVALALSHDAYHLRQVAEWRAGMAR